MENGYRAKDWELKRLALLIRTSSARSRFWRVLKAELQAVGHWKNKPRGKPQIRY